MKKFFIYLFAILWICVVTYFGVKEALIAPRNEFLAHLFFILGIDIMIIVFFSVVNKIIK